MDVQQGEKASEVSGRSRLLQIQNEFYRNFASGAVGLSTSFAIMHPLDTLKTKMQTAAPNYSLWSTTSQRLMIRDFVRFFSKGFASSVLGAAPQGGMRLGTYEFTKAKVYNQVPLVAVSAVSAVAGDIASSLVKIPREVVTQVSVYFFSCRRLA